MTLNTRLDRLETLVAKQAGPENVGLMTLEQRVRRIIAICHRIADRAGIPPLGAGVLAQIDAARQAGRPAEVDRICQGFISEVHPIIEADRQRRQRENREPSHSA